MEGTAQGRVVEISAIQRYDGSTLWKCRVVCPCGCEHALEVPHAAVVTHRSYWRGVNLELLRGNSAVCDACGLRYSLGEGPP